MALPWGELSYAQPLSTVCSRSSRDKVRNWSVWAICQTLCGISGRLQSATPKTQSVVLHVRGIAENWHCPRAPRSRSAYSTAALAYPYVTGLFDGWTRRFATLGILGYADWTLRWRASQTAPRPWVPATTCCRCRDRSWKIRSSCRRDGKHSRRSPDQQDFDTAANTIGIIVVALCREISAGVANAKRTSGAARTSSSA